MLVGRIWIEPHWFLRPCRGAFLIHRYRWCRSCLALPPANLHWPSGPPRRMQPLLLCARLVGNLKVERDAYTRVTQREGIFHVSRELTASRPAPSGTQRVTKIGPYARDPRRG